MGTSATVCNRESAAFQDEVDGAIRDLQAQQPGIFSGNAVLSVGAYYVGLIKLLDAKGLCAHHDGEELAVKNSDSFNDQYDVLSARNDVRVGSQTYRVTCTPPAFPLPEPPLQPSPAGCPLPPSREVACSREPVGRYLADVSAAIDQILKERPELFDFTETPPGTDWPRVLDLPAYSNGIVDILTKKGYCGRWDGEEVQIKRTNEFNEQYDVDYQSNYIRTGDGIYRSSCYPAAF
jgi:hypothetical protein